MSASNVSLAPCDLVRTGFLGAMTYKQLAILLMEYQQDAFKQEFGYEMPHLICRKKVADFVMRKYKKIDSLKSDTMENDLKQVEALFWAVIQLEGDEL